MKTTQPIPILILITVVVFLLPLQDCAAVPSAIRISQVYGGGGNTNAAYQNDFIELFNASSSPVNVTGWSIQYAAATSATWHATNLSGVINASGYYLIQLASGGAVGLALPTADATGTSNMSATEGKVALVNNATILSTACPTDNSIIDMVGYGITASCFEGSGTAPSASNMESVIRASDGCFDTDNNSSDFIRGTPAPHNSVSLANPCASVGLRDLNSHSAINVWSNQNKLYVDFTKMEVNAIVEIRNLVGQLLSSERISSNTIYVKEMNVAEPAYVIMKILSEDGIYIKRVVMLNQ